MKTILGLGMAAALALATMGCGKASCEDAKKELAACASVDGIIDAACMEKVTKKYAHCGK
jgi:predicted TIM-barrel enzyme